MTTFFRFSGLLRFGWAFGFYSKIVPAFAVRGVVILTVPLIVEISTLALNTVSGSVTGGFNNISFSSRLILII
jgi:hypothetical protein